MMKINITHNGKKYNNIKDAFTDAAISGIKENINNSLKPFESEIKACNGIVTIDIPKDFKNAKIQLENMPEDLIERITKALQ